MQTNYLKITKWCAILKQQKHRNCGINEHPFHTSQLPGQFKLIQKMCYFNFRVQKFVTTLKKMSIKVSNINLHRMKKEKQS